MCRGLHRDGLTVAAIAARLDVDELSVLEAHRMLAMPVNDVDDEPSSPPARNEAERQAALERLHKRIADRIRHAKGP